MEKKYKKIVIIGSGFAGVHAYLKLLSQCKKRDCFDITIVNKDDYFDFIPLSHEIATGGLMPSDVTMSIHRLPKDEHTKFLQGKAEKIDSITKTIEISLERDSGKKIEIIHYDYLLLSIGSTPDYFGIRGAKENTLPLSGLFDAKVIKNRILTAFEKAYLEEDENKRRELLTFVVIGGGPTGVELASEMADFVFDEMYEMYPDLKNKAGVILINAGDRLISVMGEWFHKKTLKILQKLGVEVLLSKKVTEVREGEVFLEDGSIKAKNIFWTAGVRSKNIDIKSKEEISKEERTGRIKVNNYLQTIADPSIYVAGDMAWIVNKENGQPYPMRAQFAVREGQIVAENILADIDKRKKKEFSWKDQGFILSLGRGGALASVMGIKISGPVAWWLYRTIYLSKLVGIRAKLRTGLEWAINLLFARDVSKL